MARVQLEIPESQREEWDAFVETSGEFRSRADLIRAAVERYIATDGTSETDRLNDDVTYLREEIGEVHETVRQIDTHLQALRQENVDERTLEDIIEYAVTTNLAQMDIYESADGDTKIGNLSDFDNE